MSGPKDRNKERDEPVEPDEVDPAYDPDNLLPDYEYSDDPNERVGGGAKKAPAKKTEDK